MASYQPPVPPDFFYISYALILAAVVWSVMSFLCSTFIANKRIEKRQKGWQIVIPVLIIGLGIFISYRVRAIQIGRELNSLSNILLPADDLEGKSPCGGTGNELGAEFGSDLRMVGWGDHLKLISLVKDDGTRQVLLGLDRLPDESVAVTANIYDATGKRLIVRIDKNHFQINRNLILDTLSPPRKDRSTLAITDEEGNTLTIRLNNRHTISFQGKIYYRLNQYVLVDDSGLHIAPDPRFYLGHLCFVWAGNGSLMDVK